MKNFEHYKDVFMRCKGRNLECVASKEILKAIYLVNNVVGEFEMDKDKFFEMPQDDEVK